MFVRLQGYRLRIVVNSHTNEQECLVKFGPDPSPLRLIYTKSDLIILFTYSKCSLDLYLTNSNNSCILLNLTHLIFQELLDYWRSWLKIIMFRTLNYCTFTNPNFHSLSLTEESNLFFHHIFFDLVSTSDSSRVHPDAEHLAIENQFIIVI